MDGKLIIYQVLPRLWGDGTFASWNSRTFAYLRSLGVDYIWYTGIPRHATGKDFVKGDPGSPYAVSDWYDVNPYLTADGVRRIEEFRALVQRTHDAGMKCLVDFIPNHVACDYSGNLAVHPWCDGDWTDTRKVDWSSPRTEAEMLSILRFWASTGVDGFRCDMVELVPSDALGRVIGALREEFPELIFVAEVYGRENYARYLSEAGFDLLYDKSGTYDILRGIADGSRQARELSWNWQSLGGMQPRMLNFLENHDEQRIASKWFAGDPSRAWAALAQAMLFNGASFMIYAGQEVGEDASEGHEGRTSIFEWCKPAGLGHLWQYICTGKGLSRRERSILSRYRSLCALSRLEAFRTGGVWDLCYCQDGSWFKPDRHFAFVRYSGREACAVFCNFGPTELEAELQLPPELLSVSGIKTNKAAFKAAPFDYAVVKLNLS